MDIASVQFGKHEPPKGHKEIDIEQVNIIKYGKCNYHGEAVSIRRDNVSGPNSAELRGCASLTPQTADALPFQDSSDSAESLRESRHHHNRMCAAASREGI